MSAERDREAVERLCASRPKRILVASDFHLCAGWDPVTTTYVATENFLADRIFAGWLGYYLHDAASTLLILNGDIFDVLRITEVPAGKGLQDWSDRLHALGAGRSVDELKAALLDHERDYGLQTDDYKTVWKLLRSARSHPVFLDALATWLRLKGRVLIIAGNHDVELHWQLVRDAIRLEMTERGVARDDAVARVAFADEHVVIDNLHVEHGHMYDEMTRVDYPPILRDEPSQINLPLGSFVNRYFINRIEALDPFIDNVKPVQDSLLRLARQRPLKILRTYGGAWRFLARAIAKRRFNRAVALIALALTLPFLSPLLLLAFPPIRDAVVGWLPFGDLGDTIVAIVSGIVLSGTLPYVAGAINELRRRRPKPHEHLAAAQRIARELHACSGRGRVYVCMGHTHVSAVTRLDADGNRLYINTGTWTALWPRDRPDLLGHTVYTYVCFDAMPYGYDHQILECPRLAQVVEVLHP
jgi:UDP-2,3-diacylglucosamine pyrophosphatase LpxH